MYIHEISSDTAAEVMPLLRLVICAFSAPVHIRIYICIYMYCI